ncbi:hypothetical protein ACGFWG_36665 [Streptomyces sp. NPDC048405]|uniref:hypothetical protein n=1 Tax=Streptomyces sp. NPDC048405 TaxID=3365544 RepID=UPI00371BA29C
MLITPDPATPAGAAIIDLATLMDDLQARTGEWPGAETADILSGWLSRFSFAVPTALMAQRAGRAWVLRRWDRLSEEVTLWSNEASALASLAQHVRSCWDRVAGTDGVPILPPADDRMAVDVYYGPVEDRCEEDYTLRAYDVLRHGDAPHSLSLTDGQACAEANSAAVFHPMEGPDDDSLPCIEIAGVLVFAYLDADTRAVQVSVHLDTTDEQLLRADGTVPVQVDVEDATVFTHPPTPPSQTPTGWSARLGRLARRATRPGGGERRGDVPETACCCEGPGPCRNAWPPKEQRAA